MQAQLRADKYVPMLESAVKANDLQDERLSAVGESIRSLRDVSSAMLQKQGEMGSDLASIRALVQKGLN